MMLRKMVGATALLAAWMGVAGTVHTYTTAQTVDEVISGDDSVVVSCPAGSVVVFTGANTFTGGTTITSGGVEIANRSALGTGTVNCLGVPPLHRTPVADFSGVTGTKPTAFTFPQGADAHWRLEVVDDVLRLWYHIPGATIYFR